MLILSAAVLFFIFVLIVMYIDHRNLKKEKRARQ